MKVTPKVFSIVLASVLFLSISFISPNLVSAYEMFGHVSTVYDGDGEFSMLDMPSRQVFDGNVMYTFSRTEYAVTAIDISNPSDPELVWEISSTTGYPALHDVGDVAVWNGYLYTSSFSGNSFSIFELRDGLPPLFKKTISDNTNGFNRIELIQNFQIIDSLLYFTSEDKYMTIADLADPLNPLVLSETTSVQWNIRASRLSISEGIAYIPFQGGQILIYDISNPSSPTFLYRIPNAFGYHMYDPRYVHAEDGLLFVASNAYNGEPPAFLTFDVSNPSAPILLDNITVNYGETIPPLLSGIYGMDKSGDYLFVASIDAHRITALDVSDPANPVTVDYFVDGNPGFDRYRHPQYVTVRGNLLFTNSWTEDAVNITSFDGLVSPLIANDDTTEVDEDASVEINILANDEADPETVTITLGQAGFGTVSITVDNTVIYTPDEDYFGSDNFEYTLENSENTQSTATVYITVNPVNDAPDIASDNTSVTVYEGQQAQITGTVADTEGDTYTLTASVGTVNENGGNWVWYFDSTDGPDETQVVTITVTDVHEDSNQTTFDLTVNNVAPEIDGNFDDTTLVGQPIFGIGTFSDPGNDTWSAVVNYGQGESALSLSGNTFDLNYAYMEPGIYNGYVRVIDSDGAYDQVSFAITVLSPTQAVANLAQDVIDLGLSTGLSNSLLAKLHVAQARLGDSNPNNDVAAVQSLLAFINQVDDKRGMELTNAEADYLIAKANEILASI